MVGHFMVLFGLCCYDGVVMLAMAKGKQTKETANVRAKAKAAAEATKKRKGRDSQPVPRAVASSAGNKGKRAASVSESSDSENEEREEPELRNWGNAVAKKVFNCERGVVQRDFNHTTVIAQVIQFHHLEFLYRDFEGYYADFVRQFFTHMYEPEDNDQELRTWVNNSVVVISADHIAKILGYPRPPAEANPHPPRVLLNRGTDILVPATYKRGIVFTGAFRPSSFHSDFALMNKLIHASLQPGEKKRSPLSKKLTSSVK